MEQYHYFLHLQDLIISLHQIMDASQHLIINMEKPGEQRARSACFSQKKPATEIVSFTKIASGKATRTNQYTFIMKPSILTRRIFMLDEKLQDLIPKKLSIFPKINEGNNPYFFFKWDLDGKTHQSILRYWFWDKKRRFKNKKKAFVNEFATLIEFSLGKGGFDRSDFERICPNTSRDCDSGFAIFIAILAYLDLITRTSPEFYSVINIEKLRELIN
jgi:hypothetical protein